MGAAKNSTGARAVRPRGRSLRACSAEPGMEFDSRACSTRPDVSLLLDAVATFKTDHDLYDLKNNPLIFNDHPTLANLKLTWVWNTVIVGALVVVITLALALPAGYALARL